MDDLDLSDDLMDELFGDGRDDLMVVKIEARPS